MKQKLLSGNMISSYTISVNRFIIVNLICFFVLTACAPQNKTQKGALVGAGGKGEVQVDSARSLQYGTSWTDPLSTNSLWSTVTQSLMIKPPEMFGG